MPATILSDNGASSGTSGIKTTGASDGQLALQTTTAGGVATTAITLDTVQNATFAKNIGLGGTAPTTSGTGITFPATQSASTDVNTLDDYEEGTWTPVITGQTSAGTGTYSYQTGRYTKIGNQVSVVCTIAWTAHTGTGNMTVTGLPFTSVNVSNVYYPFSMDYANLTVPANSIAFGEVGPNLTTAYLLSMATAGASSAALAMDSAASLYFCVTYYTST